MNIGSILIWVLCGFVVGMCAQFLVPGRQNLSLPMTAVLGVVGALVGGFVYSLVQGESVEPFSLVKHNWYGWIVAILGAIFVLWIYPFLYPKKWWN